MKPEKLLKKSIRGMSPFNGIEPSGLRMDTNANLLGANPVVTKFFGQFDPLEMNDYPTPHSDLLRKRLSQCHGFGPDQFIVGNGADELTLKCKNVRTGARLVAEAVRLIAAGKANPVPQDGARARKYGLRTRHEDRAMRRRLRARSRELEAQRGREGP